MDAEKKRLRDEVAELAGAVRALRDELVIARAAHHCHGHSLCCSHLHCNWGHCGCWTVHGCSGTVTYPQTFTVTSGSSVSGLGGGVAGYNPAVTTTLSLSN